MNTENNNTTQATNSTKSIILGIGIIAILMVLIASAGFIFFFSKEDKSSTSNEDHRDYSYPYGPHC